MFEATSLAIEARALPIEERKRILTQLPEVEFHFQLAELFRAMNSEYWVEVTHGSDEYGKDVVIVRHDPLAPDVIGVVVKVGDIRGKTVGDVDELKSRVRDVLSAKGERVTAEIISQISQAKDHEAVLKGYVRKLKVTKVMVVLVGEMSNNARERIEAELTAAGSILELPWLVENFTQYYPQVFFEGRAVDYLDALLKALEQDSFHGRSGKTLSECFVEPVIAP